MAQNPDLALWRSVLVAGLSDAAKGRAPKDVAWLRSDDFKIVCEYAGLDPDAVRRAFEGGRVETLKRRVAGRLNDCRHRSGRKTHAQRGKSGNLDVKRQATWGMSVCVGDFPKVRPFREIRGTATLITDSEITKRLT